MPPTAAFFVGITNFTLLGQDQVMFMAVKDSTLIWNGDFTNSDVPLFGGLLVPQAWSLGVELSFYLVAPFVLSSKRRIVVVFLLSLSLRFLFTVLGFGFIDPWVYRFFPTELALFMLGAISHRFIAPKMLSIEKSTRQRLNGIALISTVAAVVLFESVPLPLYVKGLLLFGFIAAVMPLLFEFQNHNRVDNLLGQLSYPIYIWHVLVLSVTTSLITRLDLQVSLTFPIVLIVTLALSWLSLRLVDDPIQILRSRYRFR
jgi:peptidoglycan/LPS O-acetylase OafA/YrhL